MQNIRNLKEFFASPTWVIKNFKYLLPKVALAKRSSSDSAGKKLSNILISEKVKIPIDFKSSEIYLQEFIIL